MMPTLKTLAGPPRRSRLAAGSGRADTGEIR
jgi:hypothetical protein